MSWGADLGTCPFFSYGLTSLQGKHYPQEKLDPLDAVPEPEALSSDHLHVLSNLPVMVPLSIAEIQGSSFTS